MAERGLLIVISGPSGVGKDAILDIYMPDIERCVRSISATTRPKRDGEEHGKSYYFMSREEFEALLNQGEMLEYTEYNGHYYGTPKKSVKNMLDEGTNVILKIEVEGGLQVKKLYPDAVLIFIVAPSWQVLEQRLRNRGTESEQAIQGRLKIARFEISQANKYDYIIINDVIENCVEKLAAVITAAGCEKRHMEKFIEEVSKNA